MSASGQIVTESQENVLTVPPRAIRRSGNEQVVDLRRGDEVIEQVVVTGLTDANNVEIVGGLEEGDVLVIPVLVGAAAEESEEQEPLPGGIQ